MNQRPYLFIQIVLLLSLILIYITSGNTFAQDRVRVFINLEDSLWKPIQQEHIREGGLSGWNVFHVWFTGTDSRYNYVVKEVYKQFEDLAYDYSDDVISKVHPGIDEKKLMQDTYNARNITESQSAVRLAMLRPARDKKPSRYVIVNYLNIKKSNEAQFEKNILEIAMPALQDRMNNGFNQGWDLYKLVVPGGDSVPYQYISFEYLDSLGLVTKPGGEDASKGMEPGKVYRTELWERVNYLGGD